ncbi:MAG: FdtA/QdtA family cupin domain-containing protein [Bacteroidaceae bacterium]|nr:FdtA/QdtA family cupin domain-containing protein [Bacteroidaceae bacterium]
MNRGFGLVKIRRNDDDRGSLCFAEWEDLPFEPQRVFWIFDVKPDMSRGKHAHSACEEVVFAVKGGFDMFVDNGTSQETFHISDPSEGIYIGKNVWCELKNFQPGTVCVVVASVKYMRDGYINDYEEFKKKCN